jgi:hypothetical protein
MSEFETSGLQRLLADQLRVEEMLKQEIKNKQEELLRCQGKILAYEELLKSSSSGFFYGDSEMFAVRGNNRLSELKGVKERAPRTTKKEMERRRLMVGKVFFQHGDLSAKELQPLVEELLGYPMEPHHLRAVLRKFSTDFIQKNDHGIWGLKEDVATDFSMIEQDHSLIFDDSSSSSETE